MGRTTRGTEASRPAWGRPPRGADLLSALLQSVPAVGRRPVLTRAEIRYPHPVRPLAAGHLAFRYSILRRLCSLRSLVWLRRLSASRWPVSPPRGAASTLLCPHWKRKASSDAWPSQTWLHSPVTPPPS